MPISIEVVLEYKLVGESSWSRRALTPMDYFDANYTSNVGDMDIDDVPLHAHAIEYLPIDPSRVENTKLSLIDTAAGATRIIIETFWNGGKNRVIERRDVVHGQEDYWELILDLEVPGDNLTNDIMRIGRHQGVPVLLSHVRITTTVNGSQIESKIHPKE